MSKNTSKIMAATKPLSLALFALVMGIPILSAGCGGDEPPLSPTPTPLSGDLTDWLGRSISYEDAKYVLADTISRVVTIADAIDESERCVALTTHWSGLREERIPDALLNAVLSELQSLPMPVYEAVDRMEANSKCERSFAQYIRVSPLNFAELNEGRIFLRIGEYIGYGGSSWEYTFELRDGHWVRVGGRSLGMF